MTENFSPRLKQVEFVPHCGVCGCKIPHEKEYFITLIQTPIKEGFIVNMGWFCPDCCARTFVNFTAPEFVREYADLKIYTEK